MYAITYLISNFIFHNIIFSAHFCGMGQRVDLFELSYIDLRIDLRGIKFRMTQKLLDVADKPPARLKRLREWQAGICDDSFV